MTYEAFRSEMNNDYEGKMRKLSDFALQNPEQYATFRERWEKEYQEEMRLHNRKVSGWK